MTEAYAKISSAPKRTLGAELDPAERRYIRAAMQAPMLARDEEKDLAIRWRDQRDQAALDQLIGSHARLVISIARRFLGYGLPYGDLIQEGNTGLLQAADRFDPERDVRFSTYATWWIAAAIQNYVLRNWSIVRTGTTPAQRRLFFNLRHLRAKFEGRSRESLGDEDRLTIARVLGVPVSAVERMEVRFSAPDRSLDAPTGDDESFTFQDMLPDPGPRPDEIVMHRHDDATRARWLAEALGRLSVRERDIIRRRFLDEKTNTLADIGGHLGVSKERIRQIEAKAMAKLKAYLSEITPDPAAFFSR